MRALQQEQPTAGDLRWGDCGRKRMVPGRNLKYVIILRFFTVKFMGEMTEIVTIKNGAAASLST